MLRLLFCCVVFCFFALLFCCVLWLCCVVGLCPLFRACVVFYCVNCSLLCFVVLSYVKLKGN